MSRLDLFRFLKEYNEIRNPVIKDLNEYKFTLFFGKIEKSSYISTFKENGNDASDVLTVRKPIKEPCPAPSNELLPWLNGGWDEVNVVDVVVLPDKRKLGEDGQTEIVEKFADNQTRVDAFKKWKDARRIWREKELPKLKATELYTRLYGLYSDINKEAESVELVLGDGQFYWKHDIHNYHHPLIAQKVMLDFDSSVPKFTITIDEPKIDLYATILRTIQGLNQTTIYELMEKIDEIGNILDIEYNIERFKELIAQLHINGVYVDEPTPNKDFPVIYSNPVLFLRKKNLGYSEFITNIIDSLEEDETLKLPDFFENLLGNFKEVEAPPESDNWNQSGIDKDILLTLNANNEQLRILKKLEHYPAVLVQGPPGTGKTHTIANLIGHLLSEGKNVLVTSHTEKALAVLKQKVHKDLQNLCISLLSSSSQRAEMENALNEINDKRSAFDEQSSLNKIKNLESNRELLIASYRTKFDELKQIRGSEFLDIIYNNETIKPIDAAKFIGEGIGKFDYIPGETRDNKIGLPLSQSELSELYRSNSIVSVEDENYLKKKWPAINGIWDPEKFDKQVSLTKELEKKSEKTESTNPLVVQKINEVKEAQILFQDLLQVTSTLENEIHEILSYILKSTINKSNWEEIFNDVESLLQHQSEYNEILATNSIHIPNALSNAFGLGVVEAIVSSNKEKPVGAFTFIKDWKEFKNTVTLNERKPEKLSEYITLKKYLSFQLAHQKVLKKVHLQLSELEMDPAVIGQSFTKLSSFVGRIKDNMNWIDLKFNEARQKLSTLIELTGKVDYVDDIKGYVSTAYTILTKLVYEFELNHEINEFLKFSQTIDNYKPGNDLLLRLSKAIQSKDTVTYADTYKAITSVFNNKAVFDKRLQSLIKLGEYASGWSEAIEHRIGIHGEGKLPEDIQDAWKWLQLNQQVTKLTALDENRIQVEINEINNQILRNSQELALEKAWVSKLSKITAEQNHAITGWKQTIKNIGKGTGKRAAKLRMEAKKLMAKCQTAIPVWIMPLAQVANNFNPSDNQFDVVIIDEASQADMLALPALYLGKKVIVVGDDQQVSPDAVGQNIDNMDALIKQYLLHVPNHHLFNEKQSIYDMASMANFSPIVLKEHFRCLPEIIAFSNELSYSGRIKPLRDASQVPITPPLVEYRVDGGTRGGDGKINKVEAEHIVSLIHAMLQNPKYRDQTIGVISMLGEDQAKYIDNLIQNSIPAEEYEQRRILCGTPPQFQGDERDVIFLSLVDGPKAEGGPLSLMDAESRSGLQKKRYNVAVSRAKNQLWVVHSLNPDIDLKSQDLRLRLISHARNFTKTALQLDRAESPFELEIMSALIQRGYNVVPQWQAGAFRIDIVVVSGMKKVAIECDGERYHTPEKLVEDMNRQAILERLGWRFIRIRGSKYYSNKQGTIAELFKELESREIVPSNTDSPEEKNGETNQTLIDELKRMAQEYRHSGKIVEVTMGFDETVETPQQIEAPEQIQQPIVDLPKVSPPTKEELPREGNTKKPLFDFRNNK